MTGDEDLIRLKQTLKLVEKENRHLQSVRSRLFFNREELTGEWLLDLLSTPEGEDKLESFGSKFARMQDTVIDKLLPRLLAAAGEKPGAAIDNLNRAERLELISDAQEWIAMRRLRNKLVYEYIESDEEMLPALQQANKFSDELKNTYEKISEYANKHLGI